MRWWRGCPSNELSNEELLSNTQMMIAYWMWRWKPGRLESTNLGAFVCAIQWMGGMLGLKSTAAWSVWSRASLTMLRLPCLISTSSSLVGLLTSVYSLFTNYIDFPRDLIYQRFCFGPTIPVIHVSGFHCIGINALLHSFTAISENVGQLADNIFNILPNTRTVLWPIHLRNFITYP